MSEKSQYRRVVTGLDDQGKSCVIIDGPVPGGKGLVWRTLGIPADNSDAVDTADVPYSMELMHSGGSNFIISEVPAGVPRFMHATDTTDYVYVASGELVVELEAGEVTLRAGDCFVDRGVLHSFRNDSGEKAVIVGVNVPAHPVGGGRTV
jgi:mannose-6-phosphate isomerase-like protein (cupin superfamily)